MTKSQLLLRLNKDTPHYLSLFKDWKGIKSEISNPKSKKARKSIKLLKRRIAQVIESCAVSNVDGISPVEGVVIRLQSGVMIKLQTATYLSIQKVQMPLYSVFKLSKKWDLPHVLKYPTKTYQQIRDHLDVPLKTIITHYSNDSLYDTIKKYLEMNSDLTVDTSKYNQWLSQRESREMLKKLSDGNVVKMYVAPSVCFGGRSNLTAGTTTYEPVSKINKGPHIKEIEKE